MFYRRHLCRLDVWPDCMNRTFEKMNQNPEVYHTMNGPSEFHVIGTLKDWDITNRLGEIRIPALVLDGRYDEATPMITEMVHRAIPGSEWVIFEKSSHSPHLEDTERYLRVVDDFLARADEQAR